jgi:hypothetical protein
MHTVQVEQLSNPRKPAFSHTAGGRYTGCAGGGGCEFATAVLALLSLSQILRLLIRVFSRLANIFVLLAQGLERGSYEPDVTGSIPVWDTPAS